ncbi:RNA polymerase Rpb4 family protein [Halobacterium jilantaiense]|uniref:DNA-directed RNA polymerase subunit Rpo4 n=1 Tax=Halobacterium jilantaiense TaxID=355548 RepID=A0A1I0QTR8_9EURY|nr:RNA polymerase Rpb4 family protein [Halobacterium jilantaiense]SEW30827.1 DNA-directed RNA polymerase, subunit F [Halobacterium jilantaiense]
MTIFKETVETEPLTVSEAKELLSEVEAERALDEDRELRFELARAIEHTNRFAVLEPEESREFVTELLDLDVLDDESVAYKIVDLLPRTRTELRSVFANERYALSGDELDEILDVVAKYA